MKVVALREKLLLIVFCRFELCLENCEECGAREDLGMASTTSAE